MWCDAVYGRPRPTPPRALPPLAHAAAPPAANRGRAERSTSRRRLRSETPRHPHRMLQAGAHRADQSSHTRHMHAMRRSPPAPPRRRRSSPRSPGSRPPGPGRTARSPAPRSPRARAVLRFRSTPPCFAHGSSLRLAGRPPAVVTGRPLVLGLPVVAALARPAAAGAVGRGLARHRARRRPRAVQRQGQRDPRHPVPGPRGPRGALLAISDHEHLLRV